MKDIGRRPVFTKLANSEVSLADAAKYLGVAQKTLAVYHRAALDTPIKAANLLSRYDVHEDETVSSNAKGPGLLDGDFLLEGTSLGIAENNAEVVAAIPEEVRNSQSSLCESLGSLREFVLVGAESPSKDVHASPASIRSSLGSLSGVSVDLLEEENSAESLKEYIVSGIMMNGLSRSPPSSIPSRKPVKFIGPRLGRPRRHPKEPQSIRISPMYRNHSSECVAHGILQGMCHGRIHAPSVRARFLFGDPCVVVPAFSAKCAMHLTMSLAFMPPRLLLP